MFAGRPAVGFSTAAASHAAGAAVLVVQAIGVAAALAVAARLRIHLPGTPVPVTLQTFVLLLACPLVPIGAAVGGTALYAVAASIGLPVIAGPSILGPTGGYVLGFIAAAAVLGSGQARGPLSLAAIMLAAELVIHACGVVWLAAWAGRELGWAIAAGSLPFVVGDAIKLAGAWAGVNVWYAWRHRGPRQ